jgi:hypothetical protein
MDSESKLPTNSAIAIGSSINQVVIQLNITGIEIETCLQDGKLKHLLYKVAGCVEAMVPSLTMRQPTPKSLNPASQLQLVPAEQLDLGTVVMAERTPSGYTATVIHTPNMSDPATTSQDFSGTLKPPSTTSQQSNETPRRPSRPHSL